MSFDLAARLAARRAENLYRQRPLLESPQGPEVVVDGKPLLAFCNNAGPGFLLGVCGAGMFSSSRAGAALYLSHVAAALCAGLLTCRALPQAEPA